MKPQDSENSLTAPSKSQKKRDMTALQKLGEQLVELPASARQKLDLPESLADAVDLATRITSHEGRRRQMQLIGKLMRGIDAAPIEKLIFTQLQGQRDEAMRHHAVERWRTRLLAEESATEEFLRHNPRADAARLGRLLRDARQESDQRRPPRAQRDLFRFLREALGAPDEIQKP